MLFIEKDPIVCLQELVCRAIFIARNSSNKMRLHVGRFGAKGSGLLLQLSG